MKDEEKVSIEASSVFLKRLFSKSKKASNFDELLFHNCKDLNLVFLSYASNKLEVVSKLQPVKEDSGAEADNEEALE